MHDRRALPDDFWTVALVHFKIHAVRLPQMIWCDLNPSSHMAKLVDRL
jgi:hypothetical protein